MINESIRKITYFCLLTMDYIILIGRFDNSEGISDPAATVVTNVQSKKIIL